MAEHRVHIATIARALRNVCTLALSVLLSGLVVSPAVRAQNASQAGSAAGPGHQGLSEVQPVFLDIRHPGGAYRLEAVVVKKSGAVGKLPIALITHGKPRLPAEMAQIRSELLLRQARDLAHRGWLAVGVVRRGFGRSGGTPGVATNARYANCRVSDLQRYFEVEAEDLAGALRVLAQRSDADASRSIVIGGSVGGGAALGLLSHKPAGLSAVVNIAGGVRLTNAQSEVICEPEVIVTAMGRLAAGSRTPTLWLYSQNDSVFSPEVAKRAHAAFVAAGGVADLRMLPAIKPDGHHAFELPDGRVHWLAALDGFLRTHRLPTWDLAEVDNVMKAARIPASSRDMVSRYFSLFTPRVLTQAPDGRVSYSADTRSMEAARESGRKTCATWAKGDCRIIMENFTLLGR